MKDALDRLASETMIAQRLEVHFADASGNEIDLNAGDGATITVRVPLADVIRALEPSTVKVRYIDEVTGAVEDKPTWIEDDYLCFTTEHFSTYVVTGTLKATQQASGATTQQISGGATDQTGKRSTAATAQTGDPALPLAALAGALASLAAIGAAVSRRRIRR